MAAILDLSELFNMAANQNEKFYVLGIFQGISLTVGEKKNENIEDPFLVILNYQLLPLATGKWRGNIKEFEDSAIF